MSHIFVHAVKTVGFPITLNLVSTLVLSRAQTTKQRFVLRAEKKKQFRIFTKADAHNHPSGP